MKSICFSFATATAIIANSNNLRWSLIRNPPSTQTPNFPLKRTQRSLLILRSQSSSEPRENQQGQDQETLVQDLRVPDHWLLPSKALEESEWLRVTLHKWLDDEYCPEETNVEISKVAARSYYQSLLEKQTDIGEILLKMARELESISYQESFHGAFSSANAAINLIIQRIDQLKHTCLLGSYVVYITVYGKSVKFKHMRTRTRIIPGCCSNAALMLQRTSFANLLWNNSDLSNIMFKIALSSGFSKLKICEGQSPVGFYDEQILVPISQLKTPTTGCPMQITC
ncbi:hypothetical protein CRYUN_Cryun01aG0180800 [Craigia yunnanensis]